MSSIRQSKVARIILKDVADIFQKEMKNAFGSGLISVTHVFMSPDLSFAKIYLSLFGVSDKEKTLKNIRNEAKEIRRILGIKIKQQLRIVPEIAFFLDESADYADKMEKIFSAITITPELTEVKPEVKAKRKKKEE